MNRDQFEHLVKKALDELPEEFAARLDNVEVVVEDLPSRTHLRKSKIGHRYSLLGLYEGVPQTRRGRSYGLVPPDKITIFQRPIEARCRNDGEIAAEVRRVLRHEIAHHFGISDARLRQIERRSS
jgi:predicted Zn-dependent protease with MMP-like domain